MELLLKAGRLVDGTGAGAIRNGAIRIEGERIKAIGRADDFGVEPAVQTLDLGDVTLTPGFVDTHMHVTGSGTLDAPENMKSDSDETLLLRCAVNAQTALREGITTYRDCGARNRVIFTFRDAVRRKVVPSPKLLAAGGAITWTGGYAWFFGVEADTPEDILKAIRGQVRLGADFIKIMVTSGIIFGPSVGVLHYDADTMGLAVREAAKMGRLVAAHCLAVDGIRASVAAGVRTIEHCAFFDATIPGERYESALTEEMARKGIYVNTSHGWCCCSSRALAEEALQSDSKLARAARARLGFADTSRRLREAGVRLIPGSDAGWFGQPFGEYAVMAKLFVEEIGMSPKEAFEACTRVAAEAIGLGGEIGTLEPGKRADIVALDGDPTTDITAMERVRLTMVDGAIAYRERGVRTREEVSAALR